MEKKDLLDLDFDFLVDNQQAKPQPNTSEPEEDKDDDGKRRVTVKFEGQDHVVSWYEGTASSDVMEAILCACDCILESGFELVDSDGKTVDFHKSNAIKSGEVYHLYKGEEMKEFRSILGDKWRKVKITVNPLRHAEAQRAIEIMQIGSNLLKYTGKGIPHIRQFQLSGDMQRVFWYSGSKPQSETCIDMMLVENVAVGGQASPLVKKSLPMFSNISFGVVYKHKGKERTVNITCKDELEFDLWVCGIKALSYYFKGLSISKLELLSHSRRFNECIEKKQIGESTKIFFSPLPKEDSKKTLENYVIKRLRSKEELYENNMRIEGRLANLRDEVDEATDSLNVEPESKMEGYKILSAQESEADDSLQLRNRMNELLDSCAKENEQVKHDLAAVVEEPGKDLEHENELKRIDAKLWKIEIDIENVLDMIKRIKKQSDVTWKERFKNWFPKIF
eukprot:TRINITY_DN11111_c0_g4_i1.p1 TRINITY_DN11111_c0_g4~~TRINITY_DN11111_c0_g4_i1.p1  ORF type:complete len:450 (+),score=150.51 TRINITY_DN11111_c0_g4_i1:115-1464(+)